MMDQAVKSRPRSSLILYFLGRYKRLYTVVLAVILVSSVLESLSVAAVFPLFSSLLGGSPDEAGGILGMMNSLVDKVPISNRTVAGAVLVISIFSFKILFVLARDILIGYASARVLYDVRKQVMETYGGAHYQFYLDNKQGTLLYNSLAAPSAVHTILLSGSRILASFFKVVTITVVLVSILPLAALAFLVLGVAYYGGIHVLSKRVSFILGEKRAKARTEQTVIINEFFSGFHQILTFRAIKSWLGRFDRENRRDRTLLVQNQAWQATPRPVMEFFSLALLLSFLSIFKVLGSDNFADNLAALGVFAVALVQLIPSLTSTGSAWMGMIGSLPDAERAYETITGPVPRRHEGDREMDSFQKSIAFKAVSFAYPNREPLFKDVSLEFEKGKVTAIVGASGSGKTTIVNLILGLFEPTRGSITIDGMSLKEFKQESWLGKIGFVSQEPFTFHSTIADNIRFGRNGHSTESLVEAAKIANAHGFISELPQGYDTEVGERGMKLSGGQQQRLAIARAVLAGPEILVFDEATSALDSISEKLVQEAIDKVSSNRTAIIIAHRLSTVRNADKIIVLAGGEMVEEGTHQELLSKNGHYARLAASGR